MHSLDVKMCLRIIFSYFSQSSYELLNVIDYVIAIEENMGEVQNQHDDVLSESGDENGTNSSNIAEGKTSLGDSVTVPKGVWSLRI